MQNINLSNERLKMEWAAQLAKEYQPVTVDQKLAALAEYEAATDYADFTLITDDSVSAYIEAVMSRDIANRTRVSNVRQVKNFFEYLMMSERLSGKRGYGPTKSLKLSRKNRIAGKASKSRPVPTLKDIIATMLAMPKTTAIERRNRALLAFTILSGARDGAIISMRVGHVDVAGREIMQHPDEVDTKAGAQIFTWFFPVGDDIKNEVTDYITYLREELGFVDDDPLFPSTKSGHDENDQFTPSGLTKRRWANAQPMRDIFRAAFAANDLPYYNPHSFRKTLMALAYELKLDVEELKAWSQNLGHKKLDTSINSYGNVSKDRQKAAMLALHDNNPKDDKSRPATIADIEAIFLQRDRRDGFRL